MGALAVASIVIFSFLRMAWLGWFLAGAIAGTVILFRNYQIDLLAGVSERVAGLAFEGDTKRCLQQIPGSEVLEDFPLEYGNIDQVVISPDGLLAVETKWTTKQVDFNATYESAQLRKGLGQARQGARELGLLVQKSVDWKMDIEIQPCLVIAGIKVPSLPGGVKVIDRVYVLVVRQHKEWTTLFRTQRLNEWQVRALADGLEETRRIRSLSASHL